MPGITFGFAGALVAVLLVVVQFLIANDLAVSRTFFLLPLIASSFWLILKAFWTNVYIFCVAEVLVLVWGLVDRHRAPGAGAGGPADPRSSPRSMSMSSAACRRSSTSI